MFRSFFMAGFECATGYNVNREWIDQIAATEHDRFVSEDYARLRRFGIHTIREAARWPLIDTGRRYDFSSLAPFVEASNEFGIQPIWDLFHYGYPDDVDLLSDAFPARFAEYCFETATYISERTNGVQYFTPVNEPSFFSWAGGHAAKFAPYLTNQGWELKVALARAAIQGVEAIWRACPGARTVHADPICRVAAPVGGADRDEEVQDFNENAVMQSWDMIAGRLMPELGGSRDHLDIVGINYYWTNQWEIGAPEFPLADDDPRRWPLSRLVEFVYNRYGGDLIISETSHVREMRAPWLKELTSELELTLRAGIPLRGVCLYPILGMPEWHDQNEWTCMGLWDLEPRDGRLERVDCEEAQAAVHAAQERIADLVEGPVRSRFRVA